MAELDILEVMKILKQRYPFLMVDRITDYDDVHVTGYKNVTINEPFFNGHFPGDPVMPGVMILESMGQVASVLLGLRLGQEGADKIAFLAGIDGARFRKPVRPGDKLITKAELTNVRSRSAKVKTTATVNDDVAAEAEFMCIIGSTLAKKEA